MKHLVLSEFLGTPWALQPEKLSVLTGVVERWMRGEKADEATLEGVRAARRDDAPYFAAADGSRLAAAADGRAPSPGAIAVVPIYGVIVQRASMLSETSGMVSAERVAARVRSAINDPSVGAIVLDVDSPGGSVYGIAELADELLSFRGQKKIVAVANSLAASAAYWAPTAAEEFVVTPGGEVGSIGVYTAHFDHSKWLEAEGVDVTLISAGKYKVEGNPYQPLSEEAKAAIQERIDQYYDAFVKAVAKHRGVTPGAVRDGFGQGRVVGAKDAVSEGMADRVETLGEVIARLSASKRAQAPRRSAASAAIQIAEAENPT